MTAYQLTGEVVSICLACLAPLPPMLYEFRCDWPGHQLGERFDWRPECPLCHGTALKHGTTDEPIIVEART